MAALSPKTGRALGAVLLAALAAYMTGLSFWRDYWLLLHPSFRWFTFAGGAGLGLAALGYARRGGPLSLSGSAALAGVLLLAVVFGQTGMTGFEPPPGAGPEAAPPEPRVEIDGREYLRLNTAELFMLLQGDAAKYSQGSYILRGEVLRSPLLDARKSFVLARTSIFCCYADAVSFGFLVEAGERPLPPVGAWLTLWGGLKRHGLEQSDLAGLKKDGVFYVAVSKEAAFAPDGWEETSTSSGEFIFEIRSEEPFAY